MDINVRRKGNSLSYCQSCGDDLKWRGKYIVKNENNENKVLCVKCYKKYRKEKLYPN